MLRVGWKADHTKEIRMIRFMGARRSENFFARLGVSCACAFSLCVFAPSAIGNPAETPVASDGTVRMSVFAEAPDIVTPIGATVDSHGRLLVIESASHFRPKNYQGPPTDRIRI